jgi:hypothetical protein
MREVPAIGDSGRVYPVQIAVEETVKGRTRHGYVLIRVGSSTIWRRLTPERARELSHLLAQAATEAQAADQIGTRDGASAS